MNIVEPKETGRSDQSQVMHLSGLTTNRFFPSILMIGAGGMLIFFSQIFGTLSRNSDNVYYMSFAGLFLVVIGAASSSFAYLTGGPKPKLIEGTGEPNELAAGFADSRLTLERQLNEFQEKALSEIARAVQISVALTPEDQEKLSESIRLQITQNIAADFVKEIRVLLIHRSMSRISLRSVQNRLRRRIDSLQRWPL